MPKPSCEPQILVVAVKLATKRGLFNFSRVEVAKAVNLVESGVSYYFSTMKKLRTAVVKHAIEHELIPILADACASRDSVGVTISEELRRKVAASIK